MISALAASTSIPAGRGSASWAPSASASTAGGSQRDGGRFGKGEDRHHSVRTDDRDGALLAADPGGHHRLAAATAAAAAIPLITSSGSATAVSVSTASTASTSAASSSTRSAASNWRVDGGPEIDRVPAGRRGRHCLSQLLLGLGLQCHDLQPGASGGVGGENVRTTGVSDHRDAIAARQRLVAQHPGGVEHLLHRVHPQHTGLGEERIDHVIGRRRRSGVRQPRPLPGSRATGLDGDDRFAAETRRAIRANFRGLPKDSRYSAITRVRSSRSQASSRSLLLTSALLPTETNCEIPSPHLAAAVTTAMPSAPDWETRPSRPGRIGMPAKVALSRTAGSVLTRPRQLGPRIRIP